MFYNIKGTFLIVLLRGQMAPTILKKPKITAKFNLPMFYYIFIVIKQLLCLILKVGTGCWGSPSVSLLLRWCFGPVGAAPHSPK